jgi:hypothetical protein
MADTGIGKDITEVGLEEARPPKIEEEDDILVVDMNDRDDVVLSGGTSKRASKSRVTSCGSKMAGSSKII